LKRTRLGLEDDVVRKKNGFQVVKSNAEKVSG